MSFAVEIEFLGVVVLAVVVVAAGVVESWCLYSVAPAARERADTRPSALTQQCTRVFRSFLHTHVNEIEFKYWNLHIKTM